MITAILSFIPSGLWKWIGGLLVILGIIAGSLVYRSHVYDEGAAAATAAEVAKNAEVLALVKKGDRALAAETATTTAATLAALKESHDHLADDLTTALADKSASDLRATRLNARLVGLLNAAAGAGPVPAADPGKPVGPSGEAAADPGDSTVYSLIQTTSENDAICLRNAARLDGIQAWYEQLRKSNSTPASD